MRSRSPCSAPACVKAIGVATLQTPHPEFLVCWLATASIGAIWVGLNPKYRLDEMLHVVTDAEPKVVISRLRVGERSYAGEIAALRAACPSIERVVAFMEETAVAFPDEAAAAGVESMEAFLLGGSQMSAQELQSARNACGGRDPCLIVYTSGSTGKPKGALLHHEGICRFAIAQNALWPVEPLRMVNYFPINHIGCLLDMSLPCIAAGGTLIFMEQFEPAACLALMAQEKATVWASVPSVFALQLAVPGFESYDLSALRLILWEGAAMPAPVIRQLLRVVPRLATNYGMTETGSAIAALEPVADEELLANCVGAAFQGVEVKLVGSRRPGIGRRP